MCLIKMREEDDDEVVATRVIKHTHSPPPTLPVVPVVAAPPPASVIDAGSIESFSSEDSRYRSHAGTEIPIVYAPADALPPMGLPAPKYAGSTSNQIIRQHQVETRRYASSARSARSSRHSLVDGGGGSIHGGSLYGGGEGSGKGGYRYVSPSRGGGSEYDGEIRRNRSGRRIDYDSKRRGSVSYVNPRESARSVRSSGGRSRERVVMVDRY